MHKFGSVGNVESLKWTIKKLINKGQQIGRYEVLEKKGNPLFSLFFFRISLRFRKK